MSNPLLEIAEYLRGHNCKWKYNIWGYQHHDDVESKYDIPYFHRVCEVCGKKQAYNWWRKLIFLSPWYDI